jgi:hypothetical protein
MKKIIVIGSFLGLSLFNNLSADNYVNGYYNSNGNYVNGYYRSDRNDTVRDNYSTYGNTNPYTGAKGTKNYDNSYYDKSYNNFSTPKLKTYRNYP